MLLSTLVTRLKNRGLKKTDALEKARAAIKKAGKRWTQGVQDVFDKAWKAKSGSTDTKKKDKASKGAALDPRQRAIDKAVNRTDNPDKEHHRRMLEAEEFTRDELKKWFPGVKDPDVYGPDDHHPKKGPFIFRADRMVGGKVQLGWPVIILQTYPSVKIQPKLVKKHLEKHKEGYIVMEPGRKNLAHVLKVHRSMYSVPSDATNPRIGNYLYEGERFWWIEYDSQLTVPQLKKQQQERDKLHQDIQGMSEQLALEHEGRDLRRKSKGAR